MSRLVATIDLTAANVGSQGTFATQTPNACSALYIMNESACFIQLDLGSNGQPIVQPWRNRLFYLPQAVQDAQWTVIAVLASGGSPASAVYVEAFAPNETPAPGTLDGAVFRQSNIGNQVGVTGISSISNDGNAAGTVVVEATPTGASGSQLRLTNDGAAILGGGNLAISNGGIVTAIPAAAIPQTAIAAGYPASSLGGGQVPAGVTVPAPQIGAGLLPSGVIVSTAATLASVIGALDNGVGQLHSTVNARGIALGYLDGAGNYHQVLEVDPNGNIITIAPMTLATGIQETGRLGAEQSNATAGGHFGTGINFKTNMANTPTSITLTVKASSNCTIIGANNIDKNGCGASFSATAAGGAYWYGSYTTVGNCLLAVDVAARTFDHHCDGCGAVARNLPLSALIVTAEHGGMLTYTCPCGVSESFNTHLTPADEADSAPQGSGLSATTRGAQAGLIRRLQALAGLPAHA